MPNPRWGRWLVKRQNRSIGSSCGKVGPRRRAEGCLCWESHEGAAAPAAVIASGVQDGEAGLQILRRR
jgi:hypothetical protein